MAIPLVKAIKSELFPIDRLDPGADIVDLFSKVLVTSYQDEDLSPGPGERFDLGLSISDELVIDLVGLEGFAVVLGGATSSLLTLGATLWPDRWAVRIGAGARLRFPRSILKPVRRRDAAWIDDDTRLFAEIAIAAGVIIDQDWNISFDGGNAFRLDPVMVADSGFVVEGDVALDLSETTGLPESAAIGLPAFWRGVVFRSLIVHLPESLSESIPIANLALTNFHIGSGGVSGTIGLNGVPGASTFAGFPFQPTALAVELRQNCLVEAQVTGTLTLPFFNTPVAIEISIGVDGSFSVGLAAVQPDGSVAPQGLVNLEKPGVLSLTLDSLAFAVEGGVPRVTLSGSVEPLFGAPELQWPTFEVKELSIDAKGNVAFDGGWLDLRQGYTLDFYGFQIEITKLGFGKSDDGGNWIGFSGALNLVEGLSAGASVEGLRITWYPDRPPRISLEGAGVELSVPDVLSFKGDVSFRELTDPQTGALIRRFDGGLAVSLICVGLEIEGQIVIGVAEDNPVPFMAIYLGFELPAGIPLGTTGIALYGFAGLAALQMEPNRAPHERWYSMSPATQPDWFHKKPGTGVADLDKWDYAPGSFAVGAGVTLGTLDNGYTFSGKFLLVVVIPGPIIMIEGRANLLKERASLSDEPVFHALALLDVRAGEVLFGLDAKYAYDAQGSIIDIGGSVEAYFSAADPMGWHLYIGKKKPVAERIGATIFKLFQAQSWFMLDARGLDTGMWVGWDWHGNFEIVKIDITASIEGGASLSFRPPHFRGHLSLFGSVNASVLGINFGLRLVASIEAEIDKPSLLLAHLDFHLDLPWPFDDISVKFDVRLKSTSTSWPTLPEPLEEVAIEHFKTSASWPLVVQDEETAPAEVPVVPMDARPRVTFTRSVHDDAFVAINPGHPTPSWEIIGDPKRNAASVKARYSLVRVVLAEQVDGAWQTVAESAGPSAPGAASRVDGSWAPLPRLPSGEPTPSTSPPLAFDKLWLYSKNPFDYTRRTIRAWDEWFSENFADYPCPQLPAIDAICFDFSGIEPGTEVSSGWAHPGEPGLRFWWPPQGRVHTYTFGPGPDGAMALCRPQLLVQVPYPNNAGIRLTLRSAGRVFVQVAWGADGSSSRTVDGVGQGQDTFEISVAQPGIAAFVITAEQECCLEQICILLAAPDDVQRHAEMVRHLEESLQRLYVEDFVFGPGRAYRLTIETRIQAKLYHPDTGAQHDAKNENRRQYAFFRTEGPPGLAALARPARVPQDERFTELDDLHLYVHQTVPPTVPAPGKHRPLPRPVYRAYDVSVELNENYVRTMYGMAQRDLVLVLVDANERPARDAQGLPVMSTVWDQSDQSPMANPDVQSWLQTLEDSDCVHIELDRVRRWDRVAARDYLLEADCVYDARLVPLLLREDFSGYALGSQPTGTSRQLGLWQAEDDGSVAGSSIWRTGADGVPRSYFIMQTSGISGTPGDPTTPGTTLTRIAPPGLPPDHLDDPATWSDYIVHAQVRTAADAPIGVVFRRSTASRYYRFSMGGGARRLVRVVDGVHEILAEDAAPFELDTDHQVTIVALGSSISVSVDGTTVLRADDAAHDKGTIGLYCSGNASARFADIRVEDLRSRAVTAYRFSFTTSRYADFHHQVHSFDDVCWRLDLGAVLLPAPAASTSLPHSAPGVPSEEEARAYEALASSHPDLAAASRVDATRLEVSRVDSSGGAAGLLVVSPEPIDWARVTLELDRADDAAALIRPVGLLKLAELARKNPAGDGHDSVTLLLRETMSLADYRVERLVSLAIRWPVRPPAASRPAAHRGRWLPYASFSPDEGILPAGTTVILTSTSSQMPASLPPGAVHRIANGKGAGPWASDAVALRIVDASGRVVHARRFLPDGDYQPVNARLVRNRDGTRLFILPVAGSLQPGTYRLRWRYRRAGVADIPVLSRAGNTSDERAVIEVPWAPLP